jgi:glycosyltransferase involved in cell wall biosynthesis
MREHVVDQQHSVSWSGAVARAAGVRFYSLIGTESVDDQNAEQRPLALFELLDASGLDLTGSGAGLLDERERRLVVGAANFHALAAPGRVMRIIVLRGPRGTLPSLTDRTVHQIEWADDHEVVGSIVLRSVVSTMTAGAPPTSVVGLVVDVGGGSEYGNTYRALPGWQGRVRRTARFLAPIQFDALRQLRTDLVEHLRQGRDAPRRASVRLRRVTRPAVTVGPPAVLFGLHWLELGGAERWALDTIRLAAEAGAIPIVITDRESSNPWITKPELAGALIVPLTHPMDPVTEVSFLNGLLETFDIRGVHVHHNAWLYARLPWLKAIRPNIPVVDSLHIREWRSGGFVDIAVRMSDVIDTHHVVSPALRDHMIGRAGLPAKKIMLATLANLTTDTPVTAKRTPDSGDPFTVAFVGRFAQQKRPYLFLRLAARLRRHEPGKFRFVMHGDGELAEEVRTLRVRLGLETLQVRGPEIPVAHTLTESDVVVISSDNEGLTLTCFEATAAGVPVLSTDVGSQASLIADGLLCPRHPYRFLDAATTKIITMRTSPDQRKSWLDEQEAKAAAFAKLPLARPWVQTLYQGWLR